MLQAIDRSGKDVEYYAVDLSLPELERTFGQIPIGKLFPHEVVQPYLSLAFLAYRPLFSPENATGR